MLAHPARAAIAALDLTTVCARLMHPEAGNGWGKQRTDCAERAYREFLMLAALFPNEDLAPTEDIDAFWHFHILDTRKYAADCQQIFGHYLHHQPDVTLADGADDADAREALGERTRALYQAAFADAAPAAGSAWFALTAGKQTAYCALSVDKKSAWCALISQQKTAWCPVVNGPQTSASAMAAAASA